MPYPYLFAYKTVVDYQRCHARATRSLESFSLRFSFPRIVRLFRFNQAKWVSYKKLVACFEHRVGAQQIRLSPEDWKGIVLNMCVVLSAERALKAEEKG